MSKKFEERVIPCKYGCGTKVFYEYVSDIFLEFKTRIHHGRRRCQQILQKNADNLRNRNESKLRDDVIEEINTIIKYKIKPGTKKEGEMITILTNLREKPTKDELVATIYPQMIYVDKDGNKRVDPKGIHRIDNTLHRIRQAVENDSVAPFSVRNKKNGIWYYDDIETPKEYEPVEIRYTKIAEGSIKTRDKFKKVVETDPEARKKAQEKLREYFGSKKKKNKEDK